MRLRPVFLNIVKIFSLFLIVIALSASSRSFAAEQTSDVPPWLRAHIGEGEGQIAQVILQRERALYFQKVLTCSGEVSVIRVKPRKSLNQTTASILSAMPRTIRPLSTRWPASRPR